MSARDDAVSAATAAYGDGGYGHAHRMNKAIAAYEAALSAAGWVVVPREPTPHMVNRGLVRADIDWRAASEDEALSDDEARRIYRAMIAAAPQEARDDAR